MKQKLFAVMATIFMVMVGLSWSCTFETPDYDCNVNCGELNCGDCNCGCCDEAISGATIYVVSSDLRVFGLPAWVDIYKLGNNGERVDTSSSEYVTPLEPEYFYELEPGRYMACIYYTLWQEPLFYGQAQFEVVANKVSEVDLELTTYQIMYWYIDQSPLDSCSETLSPGHQVPLWTFKIRHDWNDQSVPDDQEGLEPWHLSFNISSSDNVTVGDCWLELSILGGWQTISEPTEQYCWMGDCGNYYFQNDYNYYAVPVYPGMGNTYRISCDIDMGYEGNQPFVQAMMNGFGANAPNGVKWTTQSLPAYGCAKQL